MAKKRTEPVEPRKRGRPSQYSNALAERLCDAVANGKSLREAGRDEGITWKTIWRWSKERPAFSRQYARACEARLELLEGRLLELCADAHAAALDEITGPLRLQAIKQEIDTLKWILSKLLPRKYGDKAALEVTGANGTPIVAGLTEEKVAAICAKAQAARERVEADGKGQPPVQ